MLETCGWSVQAAMWWVAHKILETAQSPNSPFPFWIWGFTFGLGFGLRLVKKFVFTFYFIGFDLNEVPLKVPI